MRQGGGYRVAEVAFDESEVTAGLQMQLQARIDRARPRRGRC